MPLLRLFPSAGISIYEAAEIVARLKARFWVFGEWCRNVTDHAGAQSPASAGSMASTLSKLLYLGAIAEARHLVANRRSAGIPLPAIRQYANAQLVVFLVVDDGAGDQYDLAAAPRGEAHAVTGVKGRLLTLAHFCLSMMERGLPHPAADLRSSLRASSRANSRCARAISKRITGVGAALGGLFLGSRVRKTEIIGLMDRWPVTKLAPSTDRARVFPLGRVIASNQPGGRPAMGETRGAAIASAAKQSGAAERMANRDCFVASLAAPCAAPTTKRRVALLQSAENRLLQGR